MHPMLNIAVRAAREAGNIIARSFPHVDTLAFDTKASNDFVSDVDRMAEQAIIQVIRKHYPDHAILADDIDDGGLLATHILSTYDFQRQLVDSVAHYLRVGR